MANPQTSESAIQKKLLDGLDSRGWWTQKVVGQSRNGLPDIVAVHDGETLWIEVKRDDGKLGKSQHREIPLMARHGCNVLVVIGMDGADTFLDSDPEDIFCQFDLHPNMSYTEIRG